MTDNPETMTICERCLQVIVPGNTLSPTARDHHPHSADGRCPKATTR